MSAPSDLLSRLRLPYRRLRYGAVLAIGAGAVLLLVGLKIPLSTEPRALLLLGLLAYLGRKLHQLTWIQHAIAQLRLEEQFTTLPFDARLLGQCLRKKKHLWAQSYTFEGFRQLLMRASPEQLKTEQPHQKAQRLYHRLFQPIRPDRLGLDLSLALFLGWLGTLSSGATDLFFWIGLAAIPLLPLAEGLLFFEQRDLRQRLAELEEALAAWVYSELLDHVPQERPYAHRRLYQAQPWFSSAQASEASPDAQ